MTGKDPLNNRNIKSTPLRGYSMGDHQPPTGKHAGGRADVPWKGTRRIVDPGGRRRWNQRTWDKLRRRSVMKEETEDV